MGLSVEEIHAPVPIDPWFLRQIAGDRRAPRRASAPRPADGRRRGICCATLKAMGFSDARLGRSCRPRPRPRRSRSCAATLGVRPVYKRIDTCAAEFAARHALHVLDLRDATASGAPSARPSRPTAKKVVILGGGPNRIGQGIEFDYCCCPRRLRAARGRLRDHHGQLQPRDRLDRLRHLRPALFRAADAEDVLEIIRVEQTNGQLKGVIVQFGGQTPLKLAPRWRPPACRSSAPRPTPSTCRGPRALPALLTSSACASRRTASPARRPGARSPSASAIPIVVRPSYVLGGRAMEIVHDDASELARATCATAVEVSRRRARC
jgi:carbamoyl-phosphate synthase large subunit